MEITTRTMSVSLLVYLSIECYNISTFSVADPNFYNGYFDDAYTGNAVNMTY